MASEITFDEVEVETARQQEEIEILKAENRYLTQRVVALRALLNRTTAAPKEETDGPEDLDRNDEPA